MLVNHLYKYWRIAGTGFSFAVFGAGACVIALVLTALLYPFPLNAGLKQRWTRHVIWRATWLYVRMMWLMGLLSFDLRDTEKLRNGGELVIANHPSLLDVVFLLSVMPNTNCIVKSALFKNPFTRGVVALAGYIPNNDSGEELIDKAAETLTSGQTLIVFPEGTRTQDFDCLKFKRGAANIALKAKCKIRPVLITCEPATLRKHQPWYNVPNAPPTFTLTVLEALLIEECIDTSRPSSIQARHLTQYLQAAFSEQLNRHDTYGNAVLS